MYFVKLVCKLVIPVAGLGTRMLPATKAIPKEILPIYDRPLIEHVVREAVDNSVQNVVAFSTNNACAR
jgi:UTP--glucose-1-phosphate uridylyltransferase